MSNIPILTKTAYKDARNCYTCSSATKGNWYDAKDQCAKTDYLYRVLTGIDQNSLSSPQSWDEFIEFNKTSQISDQLSSDTVNFIDAAMKLPPCINLAGGGNIKTLKWDCGKFSGCKVKCSNPNTFQNGLYDLCQNNAASMYSNSRFPCQKTFNLPIGIDAKGNKQYQQVQNPNYNQCMATLYDVLSKPLIINNVPTCVGSKERPYVLPSDLLSSQRPDDYDILVNNQKDPNSFRIYPIQDSYQKCQQSISNLTWMCNGATKECVQINSSEGYASKAECEADPSKPCYTGGGGGGSSGGEKAIVVLTLVIIAIYLLYKGLKTL